MMRVPWLLGAVLQGLVMGGFLWLAVVTLLALQSGDRLFRYQGF